MQSHAYRPDIDGLRAIAVLSVILYHYGVAGFGGGFIGVDVFFVISGYLITNNIVSDIDQGKFTFTRFYVRRLRRLFPAMFVTIAATLVAGLVLLPGSLVEALSNSALAALASVSNIQFWLQSGYFDADAHLKPLLHTWSLSVEEQFYVVWPATLLLLSLSGKRWTIPLFLGLAALVSLIATESWLVTDASGAFFLAPFRVSEFAIGAVCVWLKRLRSVHPAVSEAMCIAGLGAIAWPVFAYTQATPFPGLAALVPGIGTGLLIACGPAPWSGRLLTHRFATGVGRISYSAYLIHWPLYVFVAFRIGFLSGTTKGVLIAATLVLAMLMYRFVEMPFRRPAPLSQFRANRTFALGCGALAAVLAVAALCVTHSKGYGLQAYLHGQGFKTQMASWTKERYALLRQICSARPVGTCNPRSSGRPNFLIIGDSHGVDALNAFFVAAPKFNFVISAQGGCPPLVEQDLTILKPTHPDREMCVRLNRERVDPAFLKGFDAIAINVLYEWYGPEHLRRFLTALRAATGARLFIFGGFVTLERECRLVAETAGLEACFDNANVKSYRPYESDVLALAAEFGAAFISKAEIFCGGGPLEACRSTISGSPATPDKHHLSLTYAREMGLWITRTFGANLEGRPRSP
ncbi:MAG: acyltransferase family protein [Hyphomicrobium sp.]